MIRSVILKIWYNTESACKEGVINRISEQSWIEDVKVVKKI